MPHIAGVGFKTPLDGDRLTDLAGPCGSIDPALSALWLSKRHCYPPDAIAGWGSPFRPPPDIALSKGGLVMLGRVGWPVAVAIFVVAISILAAAIALVFSVFG